MQLKREDEVTDEAYWDSDFRTDLQEAVRRELEAELSGDESPSDVKALVRQIIDAELE